MEVCRRRHPSPGLPTELSERISFVMRQDKNTWDEDAHKHTWTQTHTIRENIIAFSKKSTQRAQTSLAKAVHYLHIAQNLDLENEHGEPDPPKTLIYYSLCLCRDILNFSTKSVPNLLSNFWSDNHHGDPNCYQNVITCPFYHPRPLHKISSQSIKHFEACC